MTVFLLLFSLPSWGALQLPENMSQQERQESLRIIGLGASSKVLSDPFPLGGYSGLEVGFILSNLPVGDLNGFGNGVSNSNGGFSYQTLSVGKGIYNDVDLYINFTPWNRALGISEYGLLGRWGFYQAKYLALDYSLVVHSNVLNLHNTLVTNSLGLDLLSSLNFSYFTVYLGIGHIRASGQFEAPYTDRGQSVWEEVNELHTFIGVTSKLEQMFVAAELDRYTMNVYSVKVGVRF